MTTPHNTAWMQHSACRGTDPALFYEVTPTEMRHCGNRPDRLPRVQRAKAICRTCPVMAQCGEYMASWTDYVPQGVWAGTYWTFRRGQNLIAARTKQTEAAAA